MPFNIQDFRSSLQFDGARASLFDVTLSPPAGIPGLTGGITPLGREVSLKCRATSLPGDSVSSINVNYFGREIKVAGTRTFPDWSVTVINDEDFYIRNLMERWMNLLNGHVSNLRSPSMAVSSQYQSDAFVTQYAKTGEIIKYYKIIGLFPVDVAAIDLDWASGDTIEEFGITFSYQWWENLDTDQSSGFIPVSAPGIA